MPIYCWIPRITARVVISVKIQFWDQVKTRFILQPVNGTFSALQKLFNYFNGTTISTSFVLLSSLSLFGVFPIILFLYLNDAEFVMGSAL